MVLLINVNSGFSWQDAQVKLYEAFLVCPDQNFKEFWVAEGTYFPTESTDQTISISAPDSSFVFGGFAGAEETSDQRNPALNTSILSGNIGDTSVVHDNSNQIIQQINSTNITFDGFTISDSYAENFGGGLFCEGSMITVSNCIFFNLLSQGYSDIHLVNSHLLLQDTNFDQNTSPGNAHIFVGLGSILEIKGNLTIMNQ